MWNARCTSIHFAKNQLSLRLIGLSPLLSSHPRLLPQTSVRSFTRCYTCCNLLNRSSRSFGSHTANRSPHDDLHSLRVHFRAYARLLYVLADPLCKRYTGTRSQKSTHRWHVLVLVQVFSLPCSRVLFTFPLQYLCTIVVQRIAVQRRWPSYRNTANAVPNMVTYTGIIQDFHLLWCMIPHAFARRMSRCTIRVLSPILTESRLMHVLFTTQMFHFVKWKRRQRSHMQHMKNVTCGFPQWEQWFLTDTYCLRHTFRQN